MKLHHGSNVPIDFIDLTKSKKGKDFGCGFYLSDNYEKAMGMACLTTERTEYGLPYVTSFEFDENLLKAGDLKVLRFDGYTEDWAEFVVKNRNNRNRRNIHDYDIVIGPIANDKVGPQIRRYLLGDIDVHQLINELKYRNKTIQYFFATTKAISYLTPI